ncbi:MAG: MjaI family restriction endonuclease [Oscillospiraceae bacterium]|jgi:hypothetical protein|nr:MjaI family restriction endonuclease [Oscillospiraceae bacterium]
MTFILSNEEIQKINGGKDTSFPKYTSQLINWANQNAQGTRARIVGQMSDLFPEYSEQTETVSIADWQTWYLERYPNAIDTAADKIYGQVENLKSAIKLIDREMVKLWVEDLVITKTYNGLYVQTAILSAIATRKGAEYRLATPSEESKGIDGFVGDVAYSIKSDTYKTMNRLSEQINVTIVYYTKTKTGLRVEIEE